ncbi:MAG TPA: hypothetical protein VK897_24145 [Anaerolineales bacterium]|nr:hypothetical protein [Anaerolineales bacterium]
MDIFDLLSNKAYGEYIISAAAIGLFILFIMGRIIYIVLFPSKRAGRAKTFEDEIEEYRNKPISGSESIGSIGMRLGEDVRDVWGMGYSDEQINDVLTGKYTLEEMYKMVPEGNTKSPKGKEILNNKRST